MLLMLLMLLLLMRLSDVDVAYAVDGFVVACCTSCFCLCCYN